MSHSASSKPLSLVSWNINSVRLRIERVRDFVEQYRPDIVCLQEIKCQQQEFPQQAFIDMGLPHLAVSGQKGFHGVAIASHIPFQIQETPPLCQHEHARAVAIRLADGLHVHNLYVPAGGDVPDPDSNDKFAHKLNFLQRMQDYYRQWQGGPLILVGDLNIAPHEQDVWSHRQLLDVVSHTPVETEALAQIIEAGGFCDLARAVTSEDQKLYSWWSYRAKDWRKSDRGRRLDHIWANEAALPRMDMSSFTIYKDERDGHKPSDHVPICMRVSVDY